MLGGIENECGRSREGRVEITTRTDRIQEQVLLVMCALLFLEPERLNHVFPYLILWALIVTK